MKKPITAIKEGNWKLLNPEMAWPEVHAFDLRTEDRIGLTLSTQVSDRILINGKIGVPIDGEKNALLGQLLPPLQDSG